VECSFHKYPVTFRFSVGDKVLFSTGNAFVDGTWEEGKVVQVDVFGMTYKCSFLGLRNRLTTCFLIGDDDEHICRLDATPRERLMDAIDQRCSYAHIDYLVSTTQIDVTSFQDLLVARAIQSCSYDAIWWLQDKTSIELVRVVDTNGNGVLHQISMKSQAAAFFKRASEVECENKDKLKLDLSIFTRREKDVSLIGHRNHQGRSWLHALVITGNARALSIIFSPRGGMAWRVAEMICYNRVGNEKTAERTFHSATRDLEGRSLHDTARLLGRVEIEKMIDEFAVFYLLSDLHQKIYFKSSEFSVEDDLSNFSGEDPSFVARRLIRFSDEFLMGGQGHAYTLRPIRSVISHRILDGHASVVTWLIQAVPSLLDLPEVQSVRIRTRVNMNEFSQLQVYDSKASEDIDLVSLAAHGPAPHVTDYLSDGYTQYAALLSRFIKPGGFRKQNLATFISTAIEEKCRMYSSFRYDFKMMLEYKLSLLRDDECLEDRLQLLRFIVSDSVGLAPPNAVDISRWRKCGVLRWLVTESFLR
jgi:hypothetical protein